MLGFATIQLEEVFTFCNIANNYSLFSEDCLVVESVTLFCGSGLSPTCPNFEGPLSNPCLDSIWLQKGCVQEGELFPGSLPTLTKLSEWKNYNIQ